LTAQGFRDKKKNRIGKSELQGFEKEKKTAPSRNSSPNNGKKKEHEGGTTATKNTKRFGKDLHPEKGEKGGPYST